MAYVVSPRLRDIALGFFWIVNAIIALLTAYLYVEIAYLLRIGRGATNMYAMAASASLLLVVLLGCLAVSRSHMGVYYMAAVVLVVSFGAANCAIGTSPPDMADNWTLRLLPMGSMAAFLATSWMMWLSGATVQNDVAEPEKQPDSVNTAMQPDLAVSEKEEEHEASPEASGGGTSSSSVADSSELSVK
jgi:hypothetical protein